MTLISHTSQGCIFIDGEVKGLGDHNFVLSLHNPTPPTARAPCKCPQRCPARKNWVALLPSHYHLTFPFLILRSKFLTQDLKVFIGPSHFKHTRLSSELIKNKYSLPLDSNYWFRDSLFAWLTFSETQYVWLYTQGCIGASHFKHTNVANEQYWFLCNQGKSLCCLHSLKKRVIDAKHFPKLDPVGSTVRYEMTKLCTGSV